uniref:Semaphorin 7A, GPI membrane anchor (John Milton Hagen blood group) n=1 Tax=Nothobranchius kuhntae TaxID=321403 RepID=A0A1A8J6Q9_NOTKU
MLGMASATLSNSLCRKMHLRLSVCFLWLCVRSLTETSSHSPRMVFTYQESKSKSLPLPGGHTPVQIFPEGKSEVVASLGGTYLNLNFNNLQKNPEEQKLMWKDCSSQDCSYRITVVHQREEEGQVFVCGTSDEKTQCCHLKLTDHFHECYVPNKLHKIETIEESVIKEGEHSVLVETEQGTDLYITYSGAQENVGIHKFGSKRVRPVHHDKEQHYVGLVHDKRNESLQNRIYAFYKQKSKDTGLDGDMWIPYVSQVCTADIGGPKNKLQFSWTSQMNARLFCGNANTKQDFTELVDVATVHGDQQEAKIYALFRNEWDMSAVCVYSLRDIRDIFMTSAFKDQATDDRQRELDKKRKQCVRDSSMQHIDVLNSIESRSAEMMDWVQPASGSGPILFKHHNYTHICVDASHPRGNGHHVVMFLSLSDGRIHEVVQTEAHSFIIAEYHPFRNQPHITSISLDTSSKKLYVSSRSELVQLDVANCTQYGSTCEECVLSRKPYCGWDGRSCTSRGALQDVVRGNYTICSEIKARSSLLSSKDFRNQEKMVMLSPQSMYFLSCPVLSHHAQYTWHHPGGVLPCNHLEDQCIFLIDNMNEAREGKYKCESEESGYSRVLEEHELQLSRTSEAGTLGPTVWVCVSALMVRSFCSSFY